MTIQYQSGAIRRGILLARNERAIRVALEQSTDILEISEVNGVWVTEDCEPVRPSFEWETKRTARAIEEEDCICPPDLAARLIHLLFPAENEARSNQLAYIEGAELGGRPPLD